MKLSGPAQQSEIKTFLALELTAKNRGRPELTAAVLDAAKGETQALVRRIETGGFHVIGDLDDLTSSTSSAPTGTGVEVDPDELLDAAAVAVAALAQRSWVRGRAAAEVPDAAAAAECAPGGTPRVAPAAPLIRASRNQRFRDNPR